MAENIENNDNIHVAVKFWNVHEKEYSYCDDEYLIKVNKKAKTLKLKKRFTSQVWIGNYDRKSGTNKVLKIHLAISTHKKPLCDSKSKHMPAKRSRLQSMELSILRKPIQKV